MKANWLAPLLALAFGETAAHASTMSYTGTLPSPEDFVDFTVTLVSPGTVTLQTYGFGGGTNAAETLFHRAARTPSWQFFPARQRRHDPYRRFG